jgi:methanogenic corrinoid protein MtbC1
VLVAPEGEQHDAGLACLAQILEERGWRVENLGANVPADDLRTFVNSRTVDLIALSIGTRERLPALVWAIDALRGSEPAGSHLPIMVGGLGTLGIESEIAGADLVSSVLADAEPFVGSVEGSLGSRAGG